MDKSVGIIPYKIIDNKLLFFIGHPGGIINKNQKWSFLKGGVKDSEDELSTALREFKEESGIDLSGYKDELQYLGEILQNPHKKVVAFGLNITDKIDIYPAKCKSNLCEMGWPEINEYQWADFTMINNICIPSHMYFYNKISNISKNN